MRFSARLIPESAFPASFNMAVDEALVELEQKAPSLPILRFYSWSAPAYSVGYFQDVRETARRRGAEEKGVPVVRRLTGGGFVFHGEDLAFSLVLSHPNPFLKGTVRESYLRINEAVLAGLRETDSHLDFTDCKSIPSGRGEERDCFRTASCYDLVRDGRKVVGSSQRRFGTAVLHQSSVFLGRPHALVAEKIRRGFEAKWGLDFCAAPLTTEELELARMKEAGRYFSPEWAFPFLRSALAFSFFS